jgi:hypothetical protein
MRSFSTIVALALVATVSAGSGCCGDQCNDSNDCVGNLFCW